MEVAGPVTTTQDATSLSGCVDELSVGAQGQVSLERREVRGGDTRERAAEDLAAEGAIRGSTTGDHVIHGSTGSGRNPSNTSGGAGGVNGGDALGVALITGVLRSRVDVSDVWDRDGGDDADHGDHDEHFNKAEASLKGGNFGLFHSILVFWAVGI